MVSFQGTVYIWSVFRVTVYMVSFRVTVYMVSYQGNGLYGQFSGVK